MILVDARFGENGDMAPDPATSKSRSSRYKSNDARRSSGRGGESIEREAQRPESAKRKGEREGGGEESGGKGAKRRHHGGGGDGGQDGGSGSASGGHRSSKRWRAENLETLDTPISTDRWDGGASDFSKEKAFSLRMAKQDADVRESIVLNNSELQVSKDSGDGEKSARKHRSSRASLVSDNRAITVMDLQEADLSVIDTNIRIKNKVSHRRDTAFEVAELEIEQSGAGNAGIPVEAPPRSKKRWDTGERNADIDDSDDLHIRANANPDDLQIRDNVNPEGSLEMDRENARFLKGKHSGVDRDVDDIIENGRRSRGGSRDLGAEVELAESGSTELAQINDFKIQEELRNVELEKELENRIRRRREESSDRERWRDDDRDREEKRHQDSREERSREERHRSRREKEKHSDRTERERDREDRQHREDSKLSDGRQRDDRYYDSDREYRSHREDRYQRDPYKDHEDSGRADRSRDADYRDRKRGDHGYGYEGDRRPRERSTKDDHSERERSSHPSTTHMESSDAGRSDHRLKRGRDGDGENSRAERDHSRHRVRGGDSDLVAASDLIHEDKYRRSREHRDADGRYERSRGSPRDIDASRGKGRGRSGSWRGDGTSMAGEDASSPKHETRGGSPHSNRVDYGSSPLLDDRQRSPRYRSQRSPSHVDVSSASRGKGSHGEWFEHSNSVSNSSGPHRRSQGTNLHERRDRSKWHSGMEEEMKSFRASRSGDDARDVSLSPHRHHDPHHSFGYSKFPLHGQDSYPRGMGGSRGSADGRGGGWRGHSQAGSSGFDGVHLDQHGPDDLSPRDRNDRIRRMPMNRPPGSPMVRPQGPQGPQLSSLAVPPLAPLPPPPPFRPGIDNPAVLGPLGGGFDDTSVSRDSGRGDRKGVPMRRGDHGAGMVPGDGWRGVNMGGNWNSRNQGPMPGPPFPPQFGHPAAGGNVFPAMGQQFPGPPIFSGGGVRPPLDMGFGGGRFMGPGSHIGDGGDGYLGPGRGAGWHGHGEVDDGRGPLMGPNDGWDGLGPHGEDRLRHGRMDWDRGPMGIRAWERDRERAMWEERVRDGASEFLPHRGQMDPPQNHVYPTAGGVWGTPRDPQVPSEGRPRQERPLFETQDMKRKQDDETIKTHLVKPSGGRDVLFPIGGRLSKFAASTRQTVLSQLDISPDLAGKELYEEYRSLLPASLAGKADFLLGEESPLSESADDDLELEADAEAEALITGPNLLASLLPPLADGVFEDAWRLYMKPEAENRLLKSLRGSFTLPFDPATIKEPSVSLGLNAKFPASFQDHSLTVGRRTLPDRLRDGILDEGRGEPSIGDVHTVDVRENNEDGHAMDNFPVEVNTEGDPAAEDFHALHVEVAEYSDREFEAEMEDPLEEESTKDVLASGTSRNNEDLEGATEDDNLKADATVHTDSIDSVNIMEEKKEIFVETYTDWSGDIRGGGDVISEITSIDDHITDGFGAEADPGETETETVNNFVVLKSDEPNDRSPLQTENVGVAKEEAVNVESSVGLGGLNISDVSIAEIPESRELQFSLETQGELVAVASELETMNAPDVSEVQIQEHKDLHFAPETEEPLLVTAEPEPGPELDTIGASDFSQAQLLEFQGVQLTQNTQDEQLIQVAPSPEEIFKALEDNFEDVEAEIGSDFVDTLLTAKVVDEVTLPGEDSLDCKRVESVGEDLLQGTINAVAVEDENDKVAVGNDNDIVPVGEANDTVAVGVENDIVAEDTVAVGDENDIVAEDTVAVGDENDIVAEDTVAVGDENDIVAEGDDKDTVAVGDEKDTVAVGDEIDTVAVGDEKQEYQYMVEDTKPALILEDGRKSKKNVKQKDVAEEVSAPDPVEMEGANEEPTTRAGGRRTSSRLRAQQALEKQALAQAQAAAEEESLDSLLDQGSKKSSRGKARSSQRKYKRRGSTR